MLNSIMLSEDLFAISPKQMLAASLHLDVLKRQQQRNRVCRYIKRFDRREVEKIYKNALWDAMLMSMPADLCRSVKTASLWADSVRAVAEKKTRDKTNADRHQSQHR